ncbi:MAG: NAD-dependent deacylase [Planctomycetota bacterium]
MVRTILPDADECVLEEARVKLLACKKVVALTGAGISVESGIPDFRSPGGLWTVMAPEEYATLDVFLQNPAKAWKLFRAIAEKVAGAEPNPAHEALALLESKNLLAGMVTQNVDGLHQAAGSKNVIEIHGDHQHLQCLQCGYLDEVRDRHFESDEMPLCPSCEYPLKPNVVLFGEDVRGMDEIRNLLDGCDLLLVVGTSAQVYPAAGLPAVVKENNGLVFEFNTQPTALTRGEAMGGFSGMLIPSVLASVGTDYFFQGKASETLTRLVSRL